LGEKTGPREKRRYRRLRALGGLLMGLLGGLVSMGAGQAATPDFGPNVLVFDPSMPLPAIQSKLDAVFAAQERNQFGPERYAVFFKPGRYALDVNVAFYTQVLGLGTSPDDVAIEGAVHSDANWLGNGNATCNFWRACENLSVTPTGTPPLHWAVSQGTALRRMHVKGDLNLWDRGWSSGGFLADSKIDGQVNSGSQQQWFSRNADWGGWTGHNWNMTFVGVPHPPAGDWPQPTYTVVAQTPVIREKPFLIWEAPGRYAVRVPALKTRGTAGTTWGAGWAPGATLPLARFYVAQAGRDTAATLNAALGRGLHLLLTPGVYPLDSSLQVTKPGTIVLGLGFATLVPQKGTPALTVADVDGVTVGGIIFDAGPVSSPTLLQVGAPGQSRDHSKNPICLYDIVARVGGATVGAAASCVTLDAGDVVGDNLWLWRADHGAGAFWEGNPCKNGLIVNGRRVTLYGLFAEHFQEYQVLWNGEDGRVYFFQSELPYDAPSQAAWQHDGVAGYAAYKVADHVRRHEAWGLGVYGVYTRTPASCFNAFETPPAAPAVRLHHLISVWITGQRGTETTHILNGQGPTVSHARRTATLDEAPL